MTPLALFIGYLAMVMLLFTGAALIVRYRRKTKWPFKESHRLLRQPGESLRLKVARIEDAVVYELCGSIALAFGGAYSALHILAWLNAPKDVQIWGPIAVLPLVAGLTAAWMVRKMKERANYYLGWYGERLTGEYLADLQRQGYYVFHDLLAEPGKKGFNLDHVVVGPTGIAIIETKTRRKLKNDTSGHEVTFDGQQLIWPWGRERRCLQQLTNEADWLARWLKTSTGESFPIKKLISIPDWYIHEAPSAEFRVVNPKYIADAVVGRGEVVLSERQIKLIAGQLDQRCRDVED